VDAVQRSGEDEDRVEWERGEDVCVRERMRRLVGSKSRRENAGERHRGTKEEEQRQLELEGEKATHWNTSG